MPKPFFLLKIREPVPAPRRPGHLRGPGRRGGVGGPAGVGGGERRGADLPDPHRRLRCRAGELAASGDRAGHPAGQADPAVPQARRQARHRGSELGPHRWLSQEVFCQGAAKETSLAAP